MAGYTTPRKGTYRKYSDKERAAYWKKKYLRCQKLRGINMKKYRTSSEKRRW